LVDGGLVHPRPGPGDGPSPRDAIAVVPVRDQAALLPHALAALDGGVDRVIVVDDGSGDGSGDVAAALGATVVRNAGPRGPGAARNRGAAEAGGDVIVFLDADCTADAGWVAALLPHFADPAVGAVAPRVLGVAAEAETVLGRFEAARSPIDRGRREGPVRPDAAVPYLPTAALLVRRAAFSEVDGFHEDLLLGEDVDLVWRLHEAGWSVRYDPSVIVRHHHRRRLAATLRRRYLYGTAAGPLARRHPGVLAAVRASRWTFALWGNLGAGRLRAAAAVAGWSFAGVVRSLGSVEPPATRVRLAGSLFLRGQAGAVRTIGSALLRSWAPLTLVGGLVSRRFRRAALAMTAAAIVVEWAERRPRLDPVRFGALVVLDDLAYCAGAWQGCWRARTVEPLLPAGPKVGQDSSEVRAAGSSSGPSTRT
jgi:mycofactocin system glycosyltransferase